MLSDSGRLGLCSHDLILLCAQSLSRVRLFGAPGTVARQAPLSMGFPGQEYCSGLPFPSAGDLLDPGTKPTSPALAGSLYRLRHKGSPSIREFSSVQFTRSASDSLRPHGLQHARPPCPSPTPRVHPHHVHQVGDATQPSHPLSSLSPPAFDLSQNQVLFQ